MKRITLPVRKIEPIYGIDHHSKELVKRIRESGWEGIPLIPVIELPENLQVERKIFSCLDGHHRYNAALTLKQGEVRSLLYGPEDDIVIVSRMTGNSGLMSYEWHCELIKRRLESGVYPLR